ncbi:putative protein without homology [Propionibacterium freudenreichii subsp. shermanii]|nr:putative protein without homology [Propionibacterium freudenreichii subsp. shermanii]
MATNPTTAGMSVVTIKALSLCSTSNRSRTHAPHRRAATK